MIRPLPGFVLIEPLEKELKTASGMVLPETSQDRPSKGLVLDVAWHYLDSNGTAQDTSIEYLDLRGETVFFAKWQGQDVNDEGKERKLIKFEHLLGVIQ